MLVLLRPGQVRIITKWPDHITVRPGSREHHINSRARRQNRSMTFSWKIPPWERFEDCTHLAVILTDTGGGHFHATTTGVRGDDAIEALADLLMGPEAALLGVRPAPVALIGIVVRRGIDPVWLGQPPIQVAQDERGRWQVAVSDPKGADVTVFSPAEVSGVSSRLRSQYNSGN